MILRPNQQNAINKTLENDFKSGIHFHATGFKLRNSNANLNSSGNTFTYYAWAESPIVNSNGIPNNAR